MSVGYTEAKRAEYPKQDETALLIDFTAELLARRKFAMTAYPGTAWGDWIGNRAETREERMEPFIAHAETLSGLGMLTWPERTESISWLVEGASPYRGKDRAPGLDWIQTCGRSAHNALTYFRACATTGVPCRLKWSFGPQDGANRG